MLVKKDRVHSKEEQQKQLFNIKRMTPKRLIAFRGFEKISDNEAQKLINEMEELGKILYNHIHRGN